MEWGEGGCGMVVTKDVVAHESTWLLSGVYWADRHYTPSFLSLTDFYICEPCGPELAPEPCRRTCMTTRLPSAFAAAAEEADVSCT